MKAEDAALTAGVAAVKVPSVKTHREASLGGVATWQRQSYAHNRHFSRRRPSFLQHLFSKPTSAVGIASRSLSMILHSRKAGYASTAQKFAERPGPSEVTCTHEDSLGR